MNEGLRILWLTLVMAASLGISTSAALVLLYRTAVDRERAYLVQSVHDQAGLMGAVARFDRQHGGACPRGPRRRP